MRKAVIIWSIMKNQQTMMNMMTAVESLMNMKTSERNLKLLEIMNMRQSITIFHTVMNTRESFELWTRSFMLGVILEFYVQKRGLVMYI